MIERANRFTLKMEQQASRLPTFSKTRTLYRVPNRRVHEFIGREDILNQINEGLSLGPVPRIVVLRGIGGQGKTQVALEYCHREKSNQFSTIFWIDATSKSSLKTSLEGIAEYIEPATSAFSNIDNKINFALESLANWPRPWLLVFDNYDDPIAFNSLQGFIPIGKHGSILITTRHADVDALGRDRRAIELHGLQEEDALELLCKMSVKTKEDYCMTHGESIVRRLGYHPLAIAQASAYIRKRKINFESFIDHYNRRRQLILEQIPQMSQYRRRLNNSDEETFLSVFTTLELSFLQLQAGGAESRMKADFLTLFAFFNCKDISEKMLKNYYINQKSSPRVFNLLDSFVTTYFEDGYDRDLFQDILSHLRDISLLQAFSEEEDGFLHFSLHPLIKDWVKLRTNKEACQGYALLAADIVAQTIMLSWSNKQFEMPFSARREILSHLGVQMDNYDDFLQTKEEISFSRDVSIGLAEAESWFGSFYFNSGWFKEAKAMHIKALRLREEVLGQQHSDTLTSMSKVAQVLNSQGKHNESETMHRVAFQLQEEVLGQHHPDTLTSMNNLALVLTRQGKYSKAEALFRQTVLLREEILGQQHIDTLVSSSNLARVLDRQRKYKEAETIHQHTYQLRAKVLGQQHPHTQTSMNNLALVLERQDKHNEAEAIHRQTLHLRENVFGRQHPDTLISLSNLACVLDRQRKHKEAEAIHHQTLQLRAKALGQQHPHTLISMNNLALSLEHQDKCDEAKAIYQQVLQLRERVLGQGHPDTLTTISNLARVLNKQGKHNEAKTKYQQILELRENLLGHQHPLTSMIRDNLTETSALI